MKRYSFKNDYSSLAHKDILKALEDASGEQFEGYGLDSHSLHAAELLKGIIGRDADVHFVSGGTQANLLVISAALRPHEGVIACSGGHISTHEAGAIEATGHKVCTADGTDGKLTPEDIIRIKAEHTDEHMIKPGLVYISQSTEAGTVYKHRELQDLHDCCSNENLLLYMDGARLASAVNSRNSDLTYTTTAELVDAFCFGGTKNGLLFGEAVVICNESLKKDFRYILKQRGAMLAKGATQGIQFEALLTDNLYDRNAIHANSMAYRLADGIRLLGYEFCYEAETNQIFPVIPKEIIGKLYEEYDFHEWKDYGDSMAIRLVTSFNTPETAVDGFLSRLDLWSKQLPKHR